MKSLQIAGKYERPTARTRLMLAGRLGPPIALRRPGRDAAPMSTMAGMLLGAARARLMGAVAVVAVGALSVAGAAQASFTQEGSPLPVGAAQPYGVLTADFNGD